MADNVTVANSSASSLDDYSVSTVEIEGKQAQLMGSASLAVRYDEGATYTYIGDAAAGADEADAVWRIKRLTNATNTIVFADGDGRFDNVWDDRASITYS